MNILLFAFIYSVLIFVRARTLLGLLIASVAVMLQRLITGPAEVLNQVAMEDPEEPSDLVSCYHRVRRGQKQETNLPVRDVRFVYCSATNRLYKHFKRLHYKFKSMKMTFSNLVFEG